jgi:hypothetical protein
MRPAGRVLVLGWLLAALVVLALDGRLGAYLAWTAPGSLAVLVLGAVVRQQRAVSAFNRPVVPERYRAADDLAVPLVDVVDVAEREAMTGWLRLGGARKW